MMTRLLRFRRILKFIAVGLVLAAGYYLRSYLRHHHALALSPYDAFIAGNLGYLAGGVKPLDIFTTKYFNYPASFLLQLALGSVPYSGLLVFFLGALVIYLLGKEISRSWWGGFWAMAAFAVSTENLVQYTGYISASGLCYVLSWASLLFLLLYLKNKVELNLIFFSIAAVLAVVSYHTGGLALMVIVVSILGVQIFFYQILDLKMLTAILGVFGFYLYWLVFFDFSQLLLLRDALIGADYVRLVVLGIAGAVLFILAARLDRFRFLRSSYFAILPLGLAAWLLFSQTHLFTILLNHIDPSYFVSAISLNNYLGQALLLNIYLWFTWSAITQREDASESIFLKGWLLGLLFVAAGLMMMGYFARILDYLSPLMFILFGWYWSKNKKLGRILGPITILLLFTSELIIYHDPYTMRRYYDQNEINSAEKIINLELPGATISDLRTAALFSYLGDPDIMFGMAESWRFKKVFYEYPDNGKYVIDLFRARGQLGDIYVILTRSMRTVIYSTNIMTKPLEDDVYNFYQDHYQEVYNDGEMMVYRIYQGQ